MDNFDAGRVLDDDERAATLTTLLNEHPGALINALDADGKLVDLPPSVVLVGQAAPITRTALDLIAVASRPVAFDTWSRAQAVGAATAPVLLVNGVEAMLWVVDARGRHGVLLGMLVADAVVGLAAAMAERTPIAPRTGRIDKDEVAIIRSVDDRICRILGYEPEELIGTRSLDIIHPDDYDRSINAWMDMLTRPGGVSRLRARHLRKDGSWVWMELTNSNLLDEPEHCVATEMVDVSEEMAALEVLRQREQLLSRLTEALPSGVLHVDAEQQIVYANARLQTVLGIERATTVAEQFATVVGEDRALLSAALVGVLADGHDTDLEVRLHVPGDSREHLCAIAIRVLTDAADAPAGAVLCIDDVTDAAQLRAELHRRATVDALTGCLNRSAVLDELRRILAEHASGSVGTAVVFLDFDGFKEVNDTFGHETGDQLLSKAAARLRSAIRSVDVIGRLGGDEFIVVVPHTENIEQAMQVGVRLGRALDEPLALVEGLEVRLRTAIGVTWTGDVETTADAIIAAADRGMYLSKRTGSNQPVYAHL